MFNYLSFTFAFLFINHIFISIILTENPPKVDQPKQVFNPGQLAEDLLCNYDTPKAVNALIELDYGQFLRLFFQYLHKIGRVLVPPTYVPYLTSNLFNDLLYGLANNVTTVATSYIRLCFTNRTWEGRFSIFTEIAVTLNATQKQEMVTITNWGGVGGTTDCNARGGKTFSETLSAAFDKPFADIALKLIQAKRDAAGTKYDEKKILDELKSEFTNGYKSTDSTTSFLMTCSEEFVKATLPKFKDGNQKELAEAIQSVESLDVNVKFVFTSLIEVIKAKAEYIASRVQECSTEKSTDFKTKAAWVYFLTSSDTDMKAVADAYKAQNKNAELSSLFMAARARDSPDNIFAFQLLYAITSGKYTPLKTPTPP